MSDVKRLHHIPKDMDLVGQNGGFQQRCASHKWPGCEIVTKVWAYFCEPMCFFFSLFNLMPTFYRVKYYTWQKKQKLSIFFCAWSSMQVVFPSVSNLISSHRFWSSVYSLNSFRYELNFQIPSQTFESKCWWCKID